MLAAAALVIVAAPWCLPLWWMHRRLRNAAETDCDARVLAGGADCRIYGRALLRAAARPRGPAIRFAASLLGGLGVTRLERRILMMTQQRPKHPVLRAVPLIAVAAVAGVVACDAASDAVVAPLERETDVATPSAERERLLVRNAQWVAVSGTVLRRIETRDRNSSRDSRDTCGRSERDGRPRRWYVGLDGCGVGPAAIDSIYILGDPAIHVDGDRLGDGGAVLDPASIERIEVTKRAAEARIWTIYTKDQRIAPANRDQLVSERGFLETALPVESEVIAPEAAVRAAAVNERLRVQLRPRQGRASAESAGVDPIIYVDGERVGGAALSEVDPGTIERIEVLKGKQVALYPPDHAAGVVHIFTKNR